MSDSSSDLRKAVCTAIEICLERSGRKPPEFRDSDKPIKDYEGFDSQCGVEVTVELEVMLGIENLGNNIFITGDGKVPRASKLSEVVKNISGIVRQIKE